MTDKELSTNITLAAFELEKIVKAVESRPADAERCNCNQWAPGLCAYHAGICEELKATATRLYMVSGGLIKPGPK